MPFYEGMRRESELASLGAVIRLLDRGTAE